MHIPEPPRFKTTIIQLNKDIDPEDNNYEVLTNEYSPTAFVKQEDAPRRKRRRSSSTAEEMELARRRSRTKQIHSMIEKRRRTKINREFEALKYLIPACRSCEATGVGANSANKIDGMYKLTILRTAVEYILYLHHVVQQQHRLLKENVPLYSYNVGYLECPLDVNQYRNIDQEFSFHELARGLSGVPCTPIGEEALECPTPSLDSSRLKLEEPEEPRKEWAAKSDSPKEAAESETSAISKERKKQVSFDPALQSISLPQIQTIEQRETEPQNTQVQTRPVPARQVSSFLVPGPTTEQYRLRAMLASTLGPESFSQAPPTPKATPHVSPYIPMARLSLLTDFTFALSDRLRRSSSLDVLPHTVPLASLVSRDFRLLDPALKPELPRKMYFKSKVPPQNQIAHLGPSDEEATLTLLAFAKPSINKLLN